MNKQEIFTKVVTHLRAQGVQAKEHGGYCKYRANGLMCAVGCLIEDKDYGPDLECKSLNASSVQEAVTSSIGRLTPEAFDMLRDLQTAHDTRQPHEWEERFKMIAHDHKVRLPRRA